MQKKKANQLKDLPFIRLVVGSHPLSNPANWALSCCQWLLRTSAKPFNLACSLSETNGRKGRKMRTPVQIRIPHLNRRPQFPQSTLEGLHCKSNLLLLLKTARPAFSRASGGTNNVAHPRTRQRSRKPRTSFHQDDHPHGFHPCMSTHSETPRHSSTLGHIFVARDTTESRTPRLSDARSTGSYCQTTPLESPKPCIDCSTWAWIFGRSEANPDFALRMEFSPELAEAC